jgi:hypothetical protein
MGRDIFRRLKATKICHSVHKSVFREAYTKEIQVVLKITLLATLVTPVGTPSSGSASNITCIWIGLDTLKPSIDKSISRLTSTVPPITTLGKIIYSTWVFG